MRFIPTLLHGFADYAVGIGMIGLALVSDAEEGAAFAFIVLGALAIFYALITDYELGWKPYLSMPAHLAIDAAFAVVVILLPLIFSLPVLLGGASLAIGVTALILVATTRLG